MTIRLNQSGYPIKQCPECKQDININSFVGEICSICDESHKVKVFEVIEGDYNECYNIEIIKATGKQIDDYAKHRMKDAIGNNNYDDLNTDGIGYIKYYDREINPETDEYYEYDELRAEYYIECREIEGDYNGKIDIDLTNKEENDN